MKSYNRKILTDGAMANTDTLYSVAMDISRLLNCSLQAIWTGTPNGTISLQGSNDNSNWNDLDDINSQINQPSGSGGSLLLDIDRLSFAFLRVKYVNSSGSGVLNITAHHKGATNG